jgi:hypothetical protein
MPNPEMVKKLLVSVLLAVAVASAEDSSSSQANALALYPSLGQTDSAMNKRFVARVKALRAAGDPVMQRADWPLVIAKQVAEEIGITPVVHEIPPPPQTGPEPEENGKLNIKLITGAVIHNATIDHISETWVTLSGKAIYWQNLAAGEREKIMRVAEREEAQRQLLRKLDELAIAAVIEPFTFRKESTSAWVQQYKNVVDPLYTGDRNAPGAPTILVEDGSRVFSDIDEALPSNFGSGDKIHVKLWRIGFTDDSSRNPLFTRNPDHAAVYFQAHPQ